MLQPAASIIDRLGGVIVVAGACELHRTQVNRWRLPRQRGGTGGLVPQAHHPRLLAYAKQNRIKLSAEDFLPQATGARR